MEQLLEQKNREIEALKEIISVLTKKNARGAGRKQIFSAEQKEEIRTLRGKGKTYKEISIIYNCSIALIHKIINSTKSNV